MLLALSLFVEKPTRPATGDDFVGRWDVRITDADDTFTGGWFKVEKKDGALAAWLVWKWGSVGPAASVEVVGGTLRLVREEQPGKPDVFEARLVGAGIEGQVR